MNAIIVEKVCDYFKNQPIERAWIFGSYAREEENERSDIDILVNFEADYKMSLLKYSLIVNELQRLTGKKIDLVENGQLRNYVEKTANEDKVLIYERKIEG
ncbi:MAG: nucleotidyltransferase family protein [Cytophagales bacterium]